MACCPVIIQLQNLTDTQHCLLLVDLLGRFSATKILCREMEPHLRKKASCHALEMPTDRRRMRRFLRSSDDPFFVIFYVNNCSEYFSYLLIANCSKITVIELELHVFSFLSATRLFGVVPVYSMHTHTPLITSGDFWWKVCLCGKIFFSK